MADAGDLLTPAPVQAGPIPIQFDLNRTVWSDIDQEDVKVQDYLDESPDNIIIIHENMPYLETMESFRDMNKIRFKCNKPDRNYDPYDAPDMAVLPEHIDRHQYYVNWLSFRGLFHYDDLQSIQQRPGNRIYVAIDEQRPLSHTMSLEQYGDFIKFHRLKPKSRQKKAVWRRIGADHCQNGSGANVYTLYRTQLRPMLAFGKRSAKKRSTKKRSTKKRSTKKRSVKH